MGSSANNAKAFEQVFADYKAMIFKIARSYTTTAEDTHDLVQEITLQLWAGLSSTTRRINLAPGFIGSH
ncbi:RNA polymerase sigma factor [Teredinibacter turnerae]|uniref:RNA polymerase sigma factor n=1 Tax=Teredinibacter turnerae TaxID=2426 RepID=UPI000478323A|nr:sigma factor [Teredinibacter turnerae]